MQTVMIWKDSSNKAQVPRTIHTGENSRGAAVTSAVSEKLQDLSRRIGFVSGYNFVQISVMMYRGSANEVLYAGKDEKGPRLML